MVWKEGWTGRGGIGMMWQAVPLCLLWCFWREQNAWCFEGDELSAVKLKFIFLKTLYEWASLTSSFSVDVFLDFFGILSFQ